MLQSRGAVRGHRRPDANLRLGYGVRLLPKPYNHPVRSAESAAVLDLISDGRVEFGTGRSSTRLELEGFGIHPNDTREMWQEALDHIVGCWTNDELRVLAASTGRCHRAGCCPSRSRSPTPRSGAPPGARRPTAWWDRWAWACCRSASGTPPEELKRRIDIYRQGIAECTRPVGKFINDQAASFTLVNCAPTREESIAVSEESFVWYPNHGARLIGSVAQWLREEQEELGTYDYLGGTADRVEDGSLDHLTIDYLVDSKAVVVGNPDDVVETFKAYEATGCDIVFCLFNPYRIPHDKVMQTIELMGRHVIPEFS